MGMSPLAALIKECKEQFADIHGVPLSNGDIARRSGGRLTRSHVQQFATDDQHKMPAPEKIIGLALGLQVPHSVVLERALRTYGYLEPTNAASMKLDPDVIALEAESDELRAELAPRATNGPRDRRR